MESLELFLCGDVMTGRGIDQVLPHPSDPALYEPYVKDARDYVVLAERAGHQVPTPVGFSYVWGRALEALESERPDVRIINLETSVTTSDEPWPGKGIHYRMHPKNAPCIAAAHIDCCVLANNHVLDWGREGLVETVSTVQHAGIGTAGAGLDHGRATQPATIELERGGRVLVFGYGSPSSGIPPEWEAQDGRPGVALLPELSEAMASRIVEHITRFKQPGDVVVLSIHWGGNWGYAIPEEQRRFAHVVAHSGVVDVIHGHSSHHPKGLEIVAGKLVLYGCGDFLNDYEGIAGHETFRGDLGVMYFPRLDVASGNLLELRLVPMQIRRFQLTDPSEPDRQWLQQMFQRQCRPLGVEIEPGSGSSLQASWPR